MLYLNYAYLPKVSLQLEQSLIFLFLTVVVKGQPLCLVCTQLLMTSQVSLYLIESLNLMLRYAKVFM